MRDRKKKKVCARMGEKERWTKERQGSKNIKDNVHHIVQGAQGKIKDLMVVLGDKRDETEIAEKIVREK